MEEIVIKLSKTKTIRLILVTMIFMLGGGLYLLHIADTQERYPPIYLKCVAIVSLVFFGFCMIYAIIKLFDKKPGLIISNEGISDNSSAISGHLIKWHDITSIQTAQVRKTKFILIFVNNPEKYISQTSKFKRFFMKINERSYGTPLFIAGTSLQCNFDELLTMIEVGKIKYGK